MSSTIPPSVIPPSGNPFPGDMSWTYSHIITIPTGGQIHQGGFYSIPVVGFDTVMYCSVDHPPPDDFDGPLTANYPQTYWAPNNDSEHLSLKESMLTAGKAAARIIYLHAKQGRKVLSTCAVGKNRSGLAVGIALRMMMGGREAVELIKTQRPGALSNELFCKLVEEY